MMMFFERLTTSERRLILIMLALLIGGAVWTSVITLTEQRQQALAQVALAEQQKQQLNRLSPYVGQGREKSVKKTAIQKQPVTQKMLIKMIRKHGYPVSSIKKDGDRYTLRFDMVSYRQMKDIIQKLDGTYPGKTQTVVMVPAKKQPQLIALSVTVG